MHLILLVVDVNMALEARNTLLAVVDGSVRGDLCRATSQLLFLGFLWERFLDLRLGIGDRGVCRHCGRLSLHGGLRHRWLDLWLGSYGLRLLNLRRNGLGWLLRGLRRLRFWRGGYGLRLLNLRRNGLGWLLGRRIQRKFAEQRHNLVN